MINFLRRIRRELIKEKKTSIYLIYALGEVVLVVFGILIANLVYTPSLRVLRGDTMDNKT